MSAWKTFYAGREGYEYQQYVEKRYAPFISNIVQRMTQGDLVLELGCGTGTITKALHDDNGWRKIRFCATDVDPEMVKVSKERMGMADVAVYCEDAFASTTNAEVVHSHGMLEHFTDDQIRWIIREHSDARVQVHYVPGLYDEPTFGDERLMSVEEWWRICNPEGLTQIITFNEGLDYALIFER